MQCRDCWTPVETRQPQKMGYWKETNKGCFTALVSGVEETRHSHLHHYSSEKLVYENRLRALL